MFGKLIRIALFCAFLKKKKPDSHRKTIPNSCDPVEFPFLKSHNFLFSAQLRLCLSVSSIRGKLDECIIQDLLITAIYFFYYQCFNL